MFKFVQPNGAFRHGRMNAFVCDVTQDDLCKKIDQSSVDIITMVMALNSRINASLYSYTHSSWTNTCFTQTMVVTICFDNSVCFHPCPNSWCEFANMMLDTITKYSYLWQYDMTSSKRIRSPL